MKNFLYLCVVIPSLLLTLSMHSCKNGATDPEQSFIDSNETDPTIIQLSEQLTQTPGNPELFYQRARAYSDIKKYDQGLKDINQAIAMDSTNTLYFFIKGDLHFALNQTKMARKSYEQAIRLKPDFFDAHIKLGELLLIVKEHKASVQAFNNAIKVDANNPSPYFYRGMNYKEPELNDTNRAISNFQKAIDFDEKYYPAYMQLGLIHAANEPALALEYYNGALRINELSVEALYGRALIYQNQDQFDDAVKDYRKIISINPSHVYSFYNVGYINFKEDQLDKAIENFNTAIEMKPNYIDAYYMRGLCYEVKGNTKQAKENYDYALQLAPGYPLASEGLERIGG